MHVRTYPHAHAHARAFIHRQAHMHAPHAPSKCTHTHTHTRVRVLTRPRVIHARSKHAEHSLCCTWQRRPSNRAYTKSTASIHVVPQGMWRRIRRNTGGSRRQCRTASIYQVRCSCRSCRSLRSEADTWLGKGLHVWLAGIFAL